MKATYRTIIPSCPQHGHSGCIQYSFILCLLICFGIFIESCVNSALQSGHFIWNCLLEPFLSISDLLLSTHNNYTVNQKETTLNNNKGISMRQVVIESVYILHENLRMQLIFDIVG
jgi:hypothetical protein